MYVFPFYSDNVQCFWGKAECWFLIFQMVKNKFAIYSTTTPTKAILAIFLQIDQWHLHVETKMVPNFCSCSLQVAQIDNLWENLLWTLIFFSNQFGQNFLSWPWLGKLQCRLGNDNNHTLFFRFSLFSSKQVLCWSGVALGRSQWVLAVHLTLGLLDRIWRFVHCFCNFHLALTTAICNLFITGSKRSYWRQALHHL